MLKKLSAIILAVLCFTALSSIAVLAIDIDGDTWAKVDSSAGKGVFSVEDIDFVVIKQATGAVIWLKTDLNDADKEALLSKINAKDPSILNSTSDGIVFTTDRDFILKEVLNYTGSGGKYDARVTVSTVSGELTMTIYGTYSHYCYGTLVKETTTVVTTTTTTPPSTDETTVFTTTEPPFTDETTTAIETTTEETAVFTTSEPPFTNETTAPVETTTEETAVFTTSEPPFTNETSAPAETTEETAVFTTSEPPFTNETSAPVETTEETAVFTTSEPPLTNETSVTAITDPNPPYTGVDSGIGSFKAFIAAAALFGSLSGIAVLLYAIRKSGSK